MIRARFKLHMNVLEDPEDYRPVSWPIKHPYWCTGSGEDSDGDFWTIVAYADSEEEILSLWPEACEIDAEERDEYTFTSRFPRPDWLE